MARQTVKRLQSLVHVSFPLALGVCGAWITSRASDSPVEVAIAGLAGAVLGLLLALLLESFGVLVDQLPTAAAPSDLRLRQLERDKQNVLRSIREVELDTLLGKIEREQADQLTAPLRLRAIRLLRDIDKTRVDGDSSTDEAIAREVEHRLLTRHQAARVNPGPRGEER